MNVPAGVYKAAMKDGTAALVAVVKGEDGQSRLIEVHRPFGGLSGALYFDRDGRVDL